MSTTEPAAMHVTAELDSSEQPTFDSTPATTGDDWLTALDADQANAVEVAAHAARVALAVDGLDAALGSYPFTNLTGTLQLLRDVREVRVRLAELEAIVEAKAAGLMEDDTFEVPGKLFAQRRGGASRKAWDRESMNARILSAVAEHVALDTQTGVVDEGLQMAAAEAVEQVQQLARLEYRTGALKKAGIRFDDLCETEYGRRTVQVSDAPFDLDEE